MGNCVRTCLHCGRWVAGTLRIFSQPLIVGLREYRVRMFKTQELESQWERSGSGRDVPPLSQGYPATFWATFTELTVNETQKYGA